MRKKELHEPPTQSTSFLALRETPESEEKGDPSEPSGFRSVKVPVTKGTVIGNAQESPGVTHEVLALAAYLGIRGTIAATLRCVYQLQPETGHIFVKDQIYCEKHPGNRSHHPRATMWSLCFPSEPADPPLLPLVL